MSEKSKELASFKRRNVELETRCEELGMECEKLRGRLRVMEERVEEEG